MRPGIQSLLQDGTRRKFDLIYAEALDRISRDQEDAAGFFKRMSFAAVKIITLAEGEISELHVGLKGTMNALFLKDLAQKTRRGLLGRVLQGLSGGGLCYGYNFVPGETGVRRINESEAKVIRASFTPMQPDKALVYRPQAEQERHPGLFPGSRWRDTAIRGHFTRGTGFLNNELYVGRLVWNRLTYLKDPASGRRRSLAQFPGPMGLSRRYLDFGIVDDTLWEAVKTRQGAIRDSDRVANARAKRFWEGRRSRYLLSGLVYCQECGSRYASIGRDYLACSAARGSGTCSNRQSIRRAALEGLIINGLRHRLMAPELVEEFVRAVQKEINLQRRDDQALHDIKKRELTDVTRKLNGLIDAIADGLRAPGLQQRLDELEARRVQLEQDLATRPTTPVRLHPNLAQVYRRQVERLQELT